MSFRTYPDCIDSGVPWMGMIPSHWSVIQSRRLFALRNERLRPGDEQLTASQKYGVIPQKLFMELGSQRVVQVLLNSEILKHVEEGDFVISMRSFQGGIEYSNHSGCISSAYVMLKPCSNVHHGFFKYVFKSETYIQALQSTTNLVRDGQALRFENFSLVPLPSVPWHEQASIAAFLDRETAKIDALVAEQRRLIELLKEKRQAVISHAVTKGLDPNAKMKPSGIEWLGDVPGHWEVKRLKHISPSITVGIVVNPSTFVSEEGLPFIHGGDIRIGRINWQEARRILPQSSDLNAKTKLEAGDIVTVRVGAGSGMTAVVPPECEGGNCASVMLVRKGNFDSDWLCFTMNDRVVQFQLEIVQYGAAQPQFNISHAIEFWLPVPPRSEQQKITAFIRDSTQYFDALMEDCEKSVSILQERRTALIFAAVTGKIDVRHLANQEAA